MNLLIDIGNTRIKWAIQSNQDLVLTGALVHLNHPDLSTLLDQCWQALERPVNVLVSNVAGQHFQHIVAKWSMQTWGRAPEFVTVKSGDFKLMSKYSIQSLGIDRWMALLGLYGRFSLPAIVVDCGSAVTTDALNSTGMHTGGLIMPGLTMMKNALFKGTCVQPVSSGYAGHKIGVDTDGAIQSGTVNAICGMIDRFVLLLEQQDCINPKIVLTGGDAQSIAEELGRPVTIEPDLVLLGLMRIANQV
ncbi:MAG TPA: type III pantothenate kinase [Crenotrichaceae bacterium]|nr:type III pantothenate kinase [Crenotrichaceae bacterium]